MLQPVRIRQVRSLDNRIEQDHRAIKRWVRPMLGFKSVNSARAVMSGIEMVHMMRKGQPKYTGEAHLSVADHFERLAA
jgi:transposase-like protein